MGMEVVHGDIIQVTDKSILLAIGGDPDETIWIPKSVIEEHEDDLEAGNDDVDLLVSEWWYTKNEERFG